MNFHPPSFPSAHAGMWWASSPSPRAWVGAATNGALGVEPEQEPVGVW